MCERRVPKQVTIWRGNEQGKKKMKEDQFKAGDRFVAMIKDVRAEGVYIVRDSGSGCISPRCWGHGEVRKAALARIRPGDLVEVEVISWHPKANTISLVLAGSPSSKMSRSVAHRGQPIAHAHKYKPDFKPIPSGSLMVIDLANIFGKVGPAHAARVLEAIASTLGKGGYRLLFFIERRTLGWLMHNQGSVAEENALMDFCHRGDVSLVGDEADLPILQTLEVEVGSYAVSGDGFSDYAKEFPDVVGTKGRIRKFSFARVGERLNISIDGVRHMVVVPMHDEAAKLHEDSAIQTDPDVAGVKDISTDTAPTEHPKRKSASKVHIGKVSSAIRYLGKVAKKDPLGYFELAELFGSGACGGKADAKKAARYEKLGREFCKRQREMAKRYSRLNAMRIKDGRKGCPHMSKRQISDMRIADFIRGHEEIAEYFSLRRKGLRGAYAHVA